MLGLYWDQEIQVIVHSMLAPCSHIHTKYINYFVRNLSFCIASRLSFWDTVNIWTVVVLGSTLLKSFAAGKVRMSGLDGYLKDIDEPGGWRKLALTSLSSSLAVRTQASHHCSLCTHVINPWISSISSSSSVAVTLSSFANCWCWVHFCTDFTSG